LETEASGVEFGTVQGEHLALAGDDVGLADERASLPRAALKIDREIGFAGAEVLGGIERLVSLPDKRGGGSRPLLVGGNSLRLVAVALDGRTVRIDIPLSELETLFDPVLEIRLSLRRVEAGKAHQDGLEKTGKLGLGSVLGDAPKLEGDKVEGAIKEMLKVSGRVVQKIIAGVGPVGEFNDSRLFAYEAGDSQSGFTAGLVRIQGEVNHFGPGKPGKVDFLEGARPIKGCAIEACL